MDDGLFELAPVTPLRSPRTMAVGVGDIVYARYAPKFPGRCVDCLQVALEANRAGEPAPLCRQARFSRKQGAVKIYICAEHKNLREASEVLRAS